MASESVNAKQARSHFTKGKRQQHQQTKNRSSLNDGEGEDSFIFEANEAWKDFHGSLLRFYENGELCDVTLKVRLCLLFPQLLITVNSEGFCIIFGDLCVCYGHSGLIPNPVLLKGKRHTEDEMKKG